MSSASRITLSSTRRGLRVTPTSGLGVTSASALHHRKKHGNFQNRASCEGGASPDASGTSPHEAHGRSHPNDFHLLALRAFAQRCASYSRHEDLTPCDL